MINIKQVLLNSKIHVTTLLVSSFISFSPSINAFTLKRSFKSLEGTVDPITYTDSDGTFTTSPIVLSLSSSSESFFTLNEDTGEIFNRLVMDISFNNGKSGVFNEDLLGTFTIDEEGVLDPQIEISTPLVESQVDLTIIDSNLSGAGEFQGAKVKGKNPTFFDGGINIVWRFGKTPTPDLVLELPPNFQNVDIPISGNISATMVPEPLTIFGSLTALGFGALFKRELSKKKNSKQDC